MVFGTTDQALAIARTMYRRHEAVAGVLPRAAGPFAAGSPYRANDVDALRWVHATLMDTAHLVHALVFGPLPAEARETYLAEARVFAALFGIPPDAVPRSWAAFEAYNAAMHGSAALTVTGEAKALAEQLFSVPVRGIAVPRWYRALTAHLMPPRLRRDFGLPYATQERESARRTLARARRLVPLLPARLRHVGPYQEARARLCGRERPDLATRLSNRLWIGRPLLG